MKQPFTYTLQASCKNCGKPMDFHCRRKGQELDEYSQPEPHPCLRCGELVKPGDHHDTETIKLPAGYEIFGVCPLASYDEQGYPGDTFIINTHEAAARGIIEQDCVERTYRLTAFGYGMVVVPSASGE